MLAELRIDGGVLREEASLVLHGAEAVAGHAATYSKLHPFVRPALVNGAAGAVVAPHGRVIDALVDLERLAEFDLTLS